jgi:hypothetical protein
LIEKRQLFHQFLRKDLEIITSVPEQPPCFRTEPNLGGRPNRWDNHNAIARGWKNLKESYHPVTFRRIYGVDRGQQTIQTTASAPQLASGQPHQLDDDDEEAAFDTDAADL